MVTRRQFLATVVGVGTIVVAGAGVDEVVRRRAEVTIPTFDHAAPGPQVSGEYYSAARRTKVGWTVSYPPGHSRTSAVPVALVLHGFSSNHRYGFDTLRLQDAQAQRVDGRLIPAVALASIDGGNDYWHPHASGDDPIAMLTNEFLPMLRARGLRTDRLGALGWSMGGYGALLLAELHRGVVAVAAESPAIWPNWSAAHAVNATAFDSAVNWQRYSVMASIADLAGVTVRVDCGRSDPFLPASDALDRVLHPPSEVVLSPGGHDAAFWAGCAPAQLRFLARLLAA